MNGVPDAIGGSESGVTAFAAPSGSWPSWLVPTVTNPATTPSLAVAESTIPVNAGGTGATTAQGAATNIVNGNIIQPLSVGTTLSPLLDIRNYGAVIDGATDIGPSVQSAIAACPQTFPTYGFSGASCTVLLPCGGVG